MQSFDVTYTHSEDTVYVVCLFNSFSTGLFTLRQLKRFDAHCSMEEIFQSTSMHIPRIAPGRGLKH